MQCTMGSVGLHCFLNLILLNLVTLCGNYVGLNLVYLRCMAKCIVPSESFIRKWYLFTAFVPIAMFNAALSMVMIILHAKLMLLYIGK